MRLNRSLRKYKNKWIARYAAQRDTSGVKQPWTKPEGERYLRRAAEPIEPNTPVFSVNRWGR